MEMHPRRPATWSQISAVPLGLPWVRARGQLAVLWGLQGSPEMQHWVPRTRGSPRMPPMSLSQCGALCDSGGQGVGGVQDPEWGSLGRNLAASRATDSPPPTLP